MLDEDAKKEKKRKKRRYGWVDCVYGRADSLKERNPFFQEKRGIALKMRKKKKAEKNRR